MSIESSNPGTSDNELLIEKRALEDRFELAMMGLDVPFHRAAMRFSGGVKTLTVYCTPEQEPSVRDKLPAEFEGLPVTTYVETKLKAFDE